MCGVAPRLLRRLRLVMLTAYIDDSNIGDPPVYIMAGWVASVDVWKLFSSAWDDVLRMSPRIEYFKYDDAMGNAGPFRGMSIPRRDEKIKLLVDCIADANLLGVASIIHHLPFERLFLRSPSRDWRNPYLHCFYGIVMRIMRHLVSHGIDDQIQFVFDEQHMHEPLEGWSEFIRGAPPEWQKRIFGPPHFLDDKKVVAVQAADLHAGWLRELDGANVEGRELPKPIWGSRADHIRRLNWVMDEEVAAQLYAMVHGHRPITYTFGLPAAQLA